MRHMKDIISLEDLMLLQLKHLYDAETQWSHAMETASGMISSAELSRLFRESGQLANRHVNIIRNVLKQFGQNSFARVNIIARDLIREMEDLHDSAADQEVLNAGLIVAHQFMNHYKIVSYGSVASFARLLHLERTATFLHELMEEEKREDEQLTRLAEEKINRRARTIFLL